MAKLPGKQDLGGSEGRAIARRNRMDPRTERAIHAMVWLGLPRKEAAAHVGIEDNSLYRAFRRPAVKALYLSMVEELRTSEKARNIHVLVDVRDNSANDMARVQAAKELHRDPEGYGTNTMQRVPGVVIQINSSGRSERVIDVSPAPLTVPTKSSDEFKEFRDKLGPPGDDIPVPGEPEDDTAGVDE